MLPRVLHLLKKLPLALLYLALTDLWLLALVGLGVWMRPHLHIVLLGLYAAVAVLGGGFLLGLTMVVAARLDREGELIGSGAVTLFVFAMLIAPAYAPALQTQRVCTTSLADAPEQSPSCTHLCFPAATPLPTTQHHYTTSRSQKGGGRVTTDHYLTAIASDAETPPPYTVWMRGRHADAGPCFRVAWTSSKDNRQLRHDKKAAARTIIVERITSLTADQERHRLRLLLILGALNLLYVIGVSVAVWQRDPA